jgi:flagellar hook assembly protein FlgD
MVLAMLNDLNDIEKASQYTEVMKQKYPDDDLTYMAREAMGEKVSWPLNKPVVEPEIADIQLPEHYALHNNYPNPFNPQTTIQYQLKSAGNVKLEVYDLTGKLVQTIVDEYKQAGNYTIIWDARNVSSGIYLYRLQTKEFVSTKKCIKLK